MPRPIDTYTHSQFEQVNGANLGGTVQCCHCKRWQGSAKNLGRKKDHLRICQKYAAWRAAGNGQELAPPNPYDATGRRALSEACNPDDTSLPSKHIATIQRPRWKVNMNKYFDEFFDDSSGRKCACVRCLSCGFVRAKNTTRQAEHLAECKEFLSTTEGQELLMKENLARNQQQNQNSGVWNGAKPNPNLLVDSLGLNQPRGGNTPNTLGPNPSLANHLLDQAGDALVIATRHIFLLHAGCGSLTEDALNQWLAQIGYISRSLISFTGTLIGKIRIPETPNLEHDSIFRCLDLLCSAVNNLKKELEFLEATKRKYGLGVKFDEPRPPTKGFIDLFNSASCPSATLLEGMVVLWAIELLLYYSFSYAGTFANQLTSPTTQQNPHCLPSSFVPTQTPATPWRDPAQIRSGHNCALREAFIENWKSENFGCFVAACKSMVDELVNIQTSKNGGAELLACERVFKQAIWLWGQMFPEVMVLGEQDDFHDRQNIQEDEEHGAVNGTGEADESVEADDESTGRASADLLENELGLGIITSAAQAS